MVPMWSRAWRFAHVYAYLVTDVLFMVLWFAAFIAVSVWLDNGIRKGKKEDKASSGSDSKGGACNHFGYGSKAKCETARAGIGFGVVIWLLWVATLSLSVHAVLRYRRSEVSQNGGEATLAHGKVEHSNVEDETWNPSVNDVDPGERPSIDDQQGYAQLHNDDDEVLFHPPSRQGDPFADANSTLTDDGVHPGRPVTPSSSQTVITSAQPSLPPTYVERRPLPQPVEVRSSTGYVAPSALSPSNYDNTITGLGRLSFPEGNYGADFR